MCPALDLVYALTDQSIPDAKRRDLTQEFSYEFGWRPNDFIETDSPLSTVSIVVEHGLDNAAVLSFLPSHRRLRDIQIDERRSIVGVSYNTLVDWHVWIDRESVEYTYNRKVPLYPTTEYRFDHTDYSTLAKAAFDQVTGHTPNPNVPALDAILLETIANWRRILRSELGPRATTAAISALFNAIIFARAIEDFHFKLPAAANRQSSLLEHIANGDSNIPAAIQRSIIERTGASIPPNLLDRQALKPFETLSQALSLEMVRAFYGHPSVPYPYDFSVMSKHALSKIYERYVAVMQHDEPIQFSMFPTEPEEEWNKALGGIYTPQYIASFFARYLKSQFSAERFVVSSILDPACGSGIFLRTTMEQKLLATPTSFEPKLASLFGADIDENAVAASRLSLALLHLAAHGTLPHDIPIEHDDSLVRFSSTPSSGERKFDAVMVNPPFVRTELQSEQVRQNVATHLGRTATGKLDTYLAFITLSIAQLHPGGFGLFVIPQPLLTSDNLATLRSWIHEHAWLRVIADLSAIRVFEANVYVALLIVQKRDTLALTEPPVSLIRCLRDVGLALEDFLDGKRRQTYAYSMFDVPQDSLRGPAWSVRTPEENRLLSKLRAMPTLKDLSVVRQGTITGANSVFLIDANEVPSGEEEIYRPFLPDRLIGRFNLPKESGIRVFYPFVGKVGLTEKQLQAEFPATWSRLNAHKAQLASRTRVKSGQVDWWRPIWPRSPQEMLRTKIVVPEVFLIPRFGLDISGNWIVSHSPYIYVRETVRDQHLIFVLTALLNSNVASWFIDVNARKYRDQFNKVSVALLRRMPIPDLSRVSINTLRNVVDITNQLIKEAVDFDRSLALELDDIVLREIYRLSENELKLLVP